MSRPVPYFRRFGVMANTGGIMDVKRTWIVEEEQAEKIRKEAFERNVSQSKIVREALGEYYGKRERDESE